MERNQRGALRDMLKHRIGCPTTMTFFDDRTLSYGQCLFVRHPADASFCLISIPYSTSELRSLQ